MAKKPTSTAGLETATSPEICAARADLPDAAPIKAEAFVTLEYDDAGGLADTAGNGLEAFDGQSISNYSAAGMQEGESQLGVEPPTVTAIEAALPTDGQGSRNEPASSSILLRTELRW